MAVLIGAFMELKNSNQTNALTNRKKGIIEEEFLAFAKSYFFRGFSNSTPVATSMAEHQAGEARVSRPANVSFSVHSNFLQQSAYGALREWS
jgi:hypothetical protein